MGLAALRLVCEGERRESVPRPAVHTERLRSLYCCCTWCEASSRTEQADDTASNTAPDPAAPTREVALTASEQHCGRSAGACARALRGTAR